MISIVDSNEVSGVLKIIVRIIVKVNMVVNLGPCVSLRVWWRSLIHRLDLMKERFVGLSSKLVRFAIHNVHVVSS